MGHRPRRTKNLFGTGKQVQIIEKSLFDRDETLFSYGDPNLAGSRVRLNATYARRERRLPPRTRVGSSVYSLDTRWMLGGNVLDERRVDPIYDLGEEIDEFGTTSKASRCRAAGGAGSSTAASRAGWLVSSSTEDVFYPTIDTPQPLLLPENRKLVYPSVGWQFLADDYREMSELNDIGRTEDVSLGTSFSMSVGFADTSFGSDRDATLLRATFQKGGSPEGRAGCSR